MLFFVRRVSRFWFICPGVSPPHGNSKLETITPRRRSHSKVHFGFCGNTWYKQKTGTQGKQQRLVGVGVNCRAILLSSHFQVTQTQFCVEFKEISLHGASEIKWYLWKDVLTSSQRTRLIYTCFILEVLVIKTFYQVKSSLRKAKSETLKFCLYVHFAQFVSATDLVLLQNFRQIKWQWQLLTMTDF